MKEKVQRFLEYEINLDHLPGAVVQVMYKGEIILREAIGHRAITPSKKKVMTEDTVFDLASLTKVVGTLPAVLSLIDDGLVRLDDPVSYFLPEFAKHNKKDVTLRHLLTHTSGLPAHRKFYKSQKTTDEIINAICDETLMAPVGKQVMYSDLGFMLLYKIIEKVTEMPYPMFLNRTIFQPLKMINTCFNPQFPKESYAATEYSESLGDYRYGIVHDENAELMGGISGHAGIFSTIDDLTRFAQMIENNGMYQGERILSSSGLQMSRENFTPFDEDFRGLGWMLKSQSLASCGDYFSMSSYGHTGFTGTSIWFDPAIDLNVILLTNRVHYGRQPHIIRLRPRLHNLIRRYFDS